MIDRRNPSTHSTPPQGVSRFDILAETDVRDAMLLPWFSRLYSRSSQDRDKRPQLASAAGTHPPGTSNTHLNTHLQAEQPRTASGGFSRRRPGGTGGTLGRAEGKPSTGRQCPQVCGTLALRVTRDTSKRPWHTRCLVGRTPEGSS